jgi:Protein of unknown function (DUF2793)
MPDNTPILQLPLILPAQAQKHVTHNEALRLLDVMVQLSVLTRNLTVPPATPSVGDRHIVPTGATGDWAGQAGRIALRAVTGWEFIQPLAGWTAQVMTEGQAAVFDGVVWQAPSDGTVSVARLGVSTTADATNRLAVSSPATLLNHAGAGHQVKVNKATAGDTASLLFQTGFSGRAEMGTAGSDDFAVKVSADGSAFFTALQAAGATGEVTLPAPVHLGGQASDPASPPDGTLWLNTTTGEVKLRSNGVTVVVGGGGGGVTDGDKGDVTVSGTGAVWTIDAGVVTLAKMADLATSTILGRATAGTGVPEALTAAQVRTLINVANGATANAADATLLARANHTGTQAAATITGLASIATSGSASDLGAGTLPAARFDDTAHGSRAGGALHAAATTSVAGFMSGADKTKLDGIAAGAQVNVGTDLTYTAASRSLESSTGADVTLPLVTSGDAGLAPASGGGTTNFLRADGTWAAPAGGGGGTDLTYVPGTRVLESSTGADVTLPLVSITDAGLAATPEDGPDRFYAFHDCLSATGNDEFSITVSGTGAAFSVLTPQDGGIGWARLAMGTVATNRGAYHGSNFTTMRLDVGQSIWKSRHRIPVLSNATNTYSMRSGFIDAVNAESTDGVFFRYTHSVNGGNWQAVARANNVETAQDTGVTVATATTYKLEVEVNATGTSAEFRINGAVTNTITTNIPTGVGRETGYGFMVLRSVGTATFNAVDLDYIAVEQRFTGR